MFASAVAAIVLAGSIAMPSVVENPWAQNDWAPLRAEYEYCAMTSASSFSAYVCNTKAYYIATTNAQNA